MLKKFTTLPIITLMVLAISQPLSASAQDDEKHHWFMPNHPRMRRIVKACGFGAATGGLAAPILGASVGTGIVLGAGEHATVRGIKDKHDIKKKGQLDHHFW